MPNPRRDGITPAGGGEHLERAGPGGVPGTSGYQGPPDTGPIDLSEPPDVDDGVDAPPRRADGGLAEQLLAKATVGGCRPPSDRFVQEKCPLLWGLLTQDTYRDGSVRELPTIRIERVHGGYLVTLQDHASRQQCTVQVNALEDVADGLERAFESGGEVFRDYDSPRVKDPTRRVFRKKT